jgi:DNA phosphorothioation-dependent restriction protein DptG
MPTDSTKQSSETTDRIESMLDLVSSTPKEHYLPSEIYSFLRGINPTKKEAETASRIARNREHEASTFTAKLEQKRDQLTSAINSIDYAKDLDAAINQKVELTSSLTIINSLIEKDKATAKTTYKTDMVFYAIDAIKARNDIKPKLDELDAIISNAAALWNEIVTLSQKGQYGVSEATGNFALHEYVQRKARILVKQ